MTRHFYAAQRPRGFINETYVHRFGSRADRDLWVNDHEGDGDVNSATHGAFAVSARFARRTVGPMDWPHRWRTDNWGPFNFIDHAYNIGSTGSASADYWDR